MIEHGGAGVTAVEFIGLHNSTEVPVAPVNAILKNGDGERIADEGGVAEDQAALRSVEIDAADRVHLGVDPVEALLDQIQRDPVGPFQLTADQDLAMGSIHPAALDFRLHAPVRPVHPSNSL